MFDTRNLRAAALGFGLPFVLALPYPDAAISIADAAQVLSSYQVEAVIPPEPSVAALRLVTVARQYRLLTTGGQREVTRAGIHRLVTNPQEDLE